MIAHHWYKHFSFFFLPWRSNEIEGGVLKEKEDESDSHHNFYLLKLNATRRKIQTVFFTYFYFVINWSMMVL